MACAYKPTAVPVTPEAVAIAPTATAPAVEAVEPVPFATEASPEAKVLLYTLGTVAIPPMLLPHSGLMSSPPMPIEP